LDAARAVARLGVARGVDAFTRYAYLERNGQSNLAVSLGRILVEPRPHARLIDDIAPWLDRLHRQARGKHAPARLVHAERRLADAVFGVLTHDETPDRWQMVLRAMVAIEEIQTGGTAVQAGPIPKLNPRWITVANDGSAELRLAVSLGSAAACYYRKDGRNVPVDPVRHHWLPLENGARRFQVKDKRLARDSRVVMHGRDPIADLTALVERRFIESTMGKTEQRRLPLQAARDCSASLLAGHVDLARDCSASLSDLADLLAGHVDLARVSELARAFMAVDWPQIQQDHLPKPPEHQATPDEAWLAVRLAALPWPLDDNHDIRAEPAMIRRLTAGDAQGAVQIALRRLHAVGLRPPMQSAFADAQTVRLWAAALAFPIDRQTAQHAAGILDPNYRSY
jgi:CRISPR-associated protein Csx17